MIVRRRNKRMSAAKLRASAASMALLAAFVPIAAIAQAAETQSVSTDATTDDIVVTGTRIVRSDAASANPVSVIGEQAIRLNNTVTIDDILRRVPAVGNQSADASTPIGSQTGTSSIELRNLGANRTLILVNGHRYTPTITLAGVSVDINSIPVSLVERIEVLRDGASPVYGSDAVAGVVNIITRHNFDGLRLDASTGISGKGDRAQQHFSATAGKNFGAANIVVNLDYTKRDALYAGDRAYSRRPLQSIAPDGSGGYIRGYGSVISPGGSTIGPDGSFVMFTSPTSVVPLSDNGYEDDNSGQSTINGSKTYSATFQANAPLGDKIEVFLEGSYAHTFSKADGGGAIFFPGRSVKYRGAAIVPLNNPYNFLGRAFDSPIPLYRQYDEVGQRIVTTRGSTWRVFGGVRGTIADRFNWELSYGHGESRGRSDWTNQINVGHLVNSFDPVLCAAALGCVVANPFGAGSITPQVADYLRDNVVISNRYRQQIASATINGDAFRLPAGAVSLAGGVEFRRETGVTDYSPTVIAGDSSLTNAQKTTGAFNAYEAFGEVDVPIIKDTPFFDKLSVNGSVRYSHYNIFGDGVTWKAGVNWAIAPSVRIRASRGSAFRAPAIDEFAGGTLNTFTSYNDPCDVVRGITSNATVAAACRANGLPANFRQQQTRTLGARQGNPNLKPEKAQETNAGIVLTPTFIPRLSLSADYYHIRINRAVFQPAATTILNDCYLSGATSATFACTQFSRGANGQITQVALRKQNVGMINTDGLDFGMSYDLPLGGGAGAGPSHLLLNAQATYLLRFDQQRGPTLAAEHLAGKFDSTGQFGSYSRVRGLGSVAYVNPAFSLTYTLRYVSGGNANGLNPASVPANFLKTPDVYYHDLVASFNVQKKFEFIVGVQNLLDKQPPFVFNGSDVDSSSYDTVGRYFYVKAGVKF